MTARRFDTADKRFSRQWWLAAGRDLLWVAVVTILIWVYADLEFTDSVEITATVQLRLADTKDLVMLGSDMDRQDRKVTFKIKGSRGSLSAFQRELAKAGMVLPYDVQEAPLPRLDLLTVRVLNNTDLVKSAPLTVVSASPETLSVDIDRAAVLKDVEVQFRYAGETVAEAVVSPSRMDVTIAESYAKKLQETQTKQVLQTVSVNLQNVLSDKPIPVAIDPFIGGFPVRPRQRDVEVAVKISQPMDEKSLDIVVRLLVPEDWAQSGPWEKYSLKRKDEADWKKTIKFRGPKKDIERLRAEDVDAYVVLTDEDIKPVDSWLTKDVLLRLPAGAPLQVMGEKPTVSFKFVPRTPAAPTP